MRTTISPNPSSSTNFRLVTQRHLMKTIWGPDRHADTHYLPVYMSQLRHKLEPEPARTRHLITEPKRRYRFHATRIDTIRQHPSTGDG